MSKIFSIPLTLEKFAGDSGWVVGGIASSFHRDLDGEAITPDAVRQAIPGFMANRGPDGIQGGPIRLHHDFWTRFLRQAIDTLRLPQEMQMSLVAAIALPLGRVTQIWVDGEGKTHWRGVLSQANPIAQIIWQMLREGLVHLGVSLGGKIFQVQPGGRDRLGAPCTLITNIRIDELSITDNPALRLTNQEDTGAYIMALAKSVQGAIAPAASSEVQKFLRKAIGDLGGASEFRVNGDGTTTGMGRDTINPSLKRKGGGGTIKMDGAQPATGMGGALKIKAKPAATGKEPATDVYGLTVKEFTRSLAKACAMCKSKEEWCSGDMQKSLTDGAFGLAGLTDSPPDGLVNLVRLLQEIAKFARELPNMSDYQATGTMDEMSGALIKSLGEFESDMPKDLMGKPLRPPGSPGVTNQMVAFPAQYMVYGA